MRILLRDDVEHVHCASYVSGKGQLTRRPGDPASRSFAALDARRSIDKSAVRRRVAHKVVFARALLGYAYGKAPDLVVICNIPRIAHSRIRQRLRRRGTPTVSRDFPHPSDGRCRATKGEAESPGRIAARGRQFGDRMPSPYVVLNGGVVGDRVRPEYADRQGRPNGQTSLASSGGA
jgi:hypothetical protein